MNQKLHFTFAFYNLGIAIRDTLEYVQNRQSYDLNNYNAKKNSFKISLAETSPFTGFCKENGEIGEKVHKQVEDLYNLVYGDNPRFVRVEGENLTIDHTQNTKVLDLIIPLKVSIFNIITAYLNDLSDVEKDEDCIRLIELEDKFYSLVMGLVLEDYLFNNRFVKYNEEMRDHQGQENVEANFTISEMTKIVQMYNYVRENHGKKYKEFNSLDQIYTHGLDLISGKVKPVEGHTIVEEAAVITPSYIKVLTPIEEEYKKLHSTVWEKIRVYEQEMLKRKQEEQSKQNGTN